jgi:hypothetical protein
MIHCHPRTQFSDHLCLHGNFFLKKKKDPKAS